MEIEDLLKKNGYTQMAFYPTNYWKSPDKLTTFQTDDSAIAHLKGQLLVQACEIAKVKPEDAIHLIAITAPACNQGKLPLLLMMLIMQSFDIEAEGEQYYQEVKRIMEELGL